MINMMRQNDGDDVVVDDDGDDDDDKKPVCSPSGHLQWGPDLPEAEEQ